MGGSVQVFTDRQIDLMMPAAGDITANRAKLAAQLNQTDIQRNAGFAAIADARIASLQAAIDGLGAKYDALKAAELAEKTALITEYQDIKNKCLNLPTSI